MTTPPAISFSHAGVFVRDLAAMADFYTRVLGFVETDRGQVRNIDLVFLSRSADEHHQLVLATGRDDDGKVKVLNQLSFRLGTLGELRAMRDALAAEPGVSNISPIDHGIAWSVYFGDPEGNRIELFVDSPWYVAQPIADPFDLDQPDDEIMQATEARYGGDPSFRARADWRAELAARLGEDQRPG